jgi:hypothetical protein
MHTLMTGERRRQLNTAVMTVLLMILLILAIEVALHVSGFVLTFPPPVTA